MTDWYYYLLVPIAGYIVVFIAFVLGTLKRDNGVIDVFWGVNLFTLIGTTALVGLHVSVRTFIIVGLVFLWAARLSIHLLLRISWTNEDYRYKWIRDQFDKLGIRGLAFVVVSFFIVYLFQLLMGLVITFAPMFTIYMTSTYNIRSTPLDYVGLGIAVVGLLIETVADWQLKRFMKAKLAKRARGEKVEQRFITSGLWRYSRHPNYFGEVVFWWGIYGICCSVRYGVFMIFSPALIHILIYYLSGIPPLEKKFMEDPEFEKYAQKTSKFIPSWPKS